MRMVRRFLQLDRRAQRLVLRAWWVVARTRLHLSLMSYERLEARMMHRPMGARGAETAAELALAVRRASRLVPASTCLVQSLAAAWMLRGAGFEPALHIGVANGEEGFKAHAWLECEGEMLIGGEIMDEYHPFQRP